MIGAFALDTPIAVRDGPLRPNSGNIVVTADDDSAVTMTVGTGGAVGLAIDADGTADSAPHPIFEEMF